MANGVTARFVTLKVRGNIGIATFLMAFRFAVIIFSTCLDITGVSSGQEILMQCVKWIRIIWFILHIYVRMFYPLLPITDVSSIVTCSLCLM